MSLTALPKLQPDGPTLPLLQTPDCSPKMLNGCLSRRSLAVGDRPPAAASLATRVATPRQRMSERQQPAMIQRMIAYTPLRTSEEWIEPNISLTDL